MISRQVGTTRSIALTFYFLKNTTIAGSRPLCQIRSRRVDDEPRGERVASEQHAKAHVVARGQRHLDGEAMRADVQIGLDDVTQLLVSAGGHEGIAFTEAAPLTPEPAFGDAPSDATFGRARK